ncbi:hypothetical protein [Streptomyces coelicoflavus]|uniref:hypothetical protein n=1 Tax=Streptomyces coelicoflavus TaxID=285562 RepID=UPI00332DEF26
MLHEGVIAEMGDSEQVSLRPAHPYIQRLRLATPVPDPDIQARRRLKRREFLEVGT